MPDSPRAERIGAGGYFAFETSRGPVATGRGPPRSAPFSTGRHVLATAQGKNLLPACRLRWGDRARAVLGSQSRPTEQPESHLVPNAWVSGLVHNLLGRAGRAHSRPRSTWPPRTLPLFSCSCPAVRQSPPTPFATENNASGWTLTLR